MFNTKIYNSVIISSCIFGSVNIFISSLKLINESFSENKKVPLAINIINGLSMLVSGSTFIYFTIKSKKILTD